MMLMNLLYCLCYRYSDYCLYEVVCFYFLNSFLRSVTFTCEITLHLLNSKKKKKKWCERGHFQNYRVKDISGNISLFSTWFLHGHASHKIPSGCCSNML